VLARACAGSGIRRAPLTPLRDVTCVRAPGRSLPYLNCRGCSGRALGAGLGTYGGMAAAVLLALAFTLLGIQNASAAGEERAEGARPPGKGLKGVRTLGPLQSRRIRCLVGGVPHPGGRG
jgi:hypothetical protein